MPDLPTGPRKQRLAFLALIFSILLIVVGVPAGLTWHLTHRVASTAVAGVLGVAAYFIVVVGASVVQETRRLKHSAPPKPDPVRRR